VQEAVRSQQQLFSACEARLQSTAARMAALADAQNHAAGADLNSKATWFCIQ
jgi:hypothetical protein